ncbi:deoxyribodipyrimidine photo-lyase [Sporosarcina sp. GW1-11]|uniref:cryptochrome/photolyase family protein n=1 Tax=Sporosarcina sp. GW1-11 TaxID=2899126 RepID=UPI00294C8D64|nr:deoxyribodipyrimidine photo-lyase [Sporosarcina sp. GW1-11]MDV6379089.1 deoxyribodipyrimidine photo-lyase [Sporosarcina sp. GW1-11]
MGITIVWFRKDLRIHDHPALVEAAAHGEVLPVFILPETVHAASDWWVHHSLVELQKKFEQQQIQFVVRKGPPVEQLLKIQQESGADQLVFNELYDPESRKQEKELTATLEKINVQVRSFQGTLLVPPDAIFNKSGQPYKVFTPFWKQLRQEPIAQPLLAPEKLTPSSLRLASLPPEEWGLLSPLSWHEKFQWQPGETAAIECWQMFRNGGFSDYKEGRDLPAQPNVSRLSPYVATGNISVRSIWYSALATDWIEDEQIEAFLRQLAWRDFAHYQLLYFPHMLEKPVRPEFEKFPWQSSAENVHAWKTGQTGYPLVDADMRELWETGYMHNRVRMIAASFLIKHLLTDWREGMKWFEETLVDWDSANNAMGWQWVAGSGFDASPYFRIFNPIVQGEKFDGAAIYVKKWVPELRNLPGKYIFQPAEAPASVLQSAGVEIGTTYPAPIVDHRAARERALAAYDTCKKG